jgi:Bacterial PH domain
VRPAFLPLAPSHEHEFEAAHGLPEALPAQEKLLWQGRPAPLALARRVLHLNALLVYFGVLLAWRGIGLAYDGAPLATAVWGAIGLLPLAALALGLLGGIAWLMASTTVYTVTNRRIVMRVGVVLSVTFNLPFTRIATAQLRPGPDGTGDIALTLHAGDHIGYLHLWPHARPWQLRHPQPMLRALPDAEAAGRVLAQALQAAESARLRGAAPPADQPVPAPASWAQSPPAARPADTPSAAGWATSAHSATGR